MINCIGFLQKGINVEKLNKFEKDENIIEKMKHMELPIIENEDEIEESETDEFIVESDLIVYSTPNNTDLSYLQFHVYDNEMDDFVIHHDIYIFSSINDTEYLKLDNKHYVALATFENNVMVYDALIKNPMTPQILLEGHTAPVMSITKNEMALFTGGEDMNIIEWDLERLCSKSRTLLNNVPEKICFSNESIIHGSKDKIFVTNMNGEIKLNSNIENLVAYDNDIYVSDSSGSLSIFDIRNMSAPKNSVNVSSQPLTGLDVMGGLVAVSSLDGDLVIYDVKNLQVKFSHKIKTEVYSVKLSEENVLFFGDGSDNLNMKKIEDLFDP